METPKTESRVTQAFLVKENVKALVEDRPEEIIFSSVVADGRTEVFESSNYVISKPRDFHPLICKVSVFENGFKIKSVSRPFKFIYKHFIFKSEKVQTVLKNIEEQKQLAEQAKRKQTNES